MRRVKCYECGKRYDFDVDDFCPRCGAFTQPPRSTQIGMDGAVIRVDGINEEDHSNSFVHAELHQENQNRRGTVLEGFSRSLKDGSAYGRRVLGDRAQKKSGDVFSGVIDLLNDFMG